MKITKRQLKQLLKEEVSALPLENLVGGIAGLVDGMHPEDVSDVFEKVFRALPGVELQMHDAPPEEEEIESREKIGFGRGEEEEGESAGRPIGFREQLEWLILEELEHVLGEKRRRGPVTPAEQWIVNRGSQRVPKAVQGEWYRRGVRIGHGYAPRAGHPCYDDLTKCYQQNELGQFEPIGQEEESPVDA